MAELLWSIWNQPYNLNPKPCLAEFARKPRFLLFAAPRLLQRLNCGKDRLPSVFPSYGYRLELLRILAASFKTKRLWVTPKDRKTRFCTESPPLRGSPNGKEPGTQEMDIEVIQGLHDIHVRY